MILLLNFGNASSNEGVASRRHSVKGHIIGTMVVGCVKCNPPAEFWNASSNEGVAK